jgi:hypothetical protein
LFFVEHTMQRHIPIVHSAYADAMARGPKWRERLTNALRAFPIQAQKLSA